jgi:hypothetical protein
VLIGGSTKAVAQICGAREEIEDVMTRKDSRRQQKD